MNLIDTAQAIGQNVKAKRTALGLSQQQLANLSGVDRFQICRLEAGEVGDRGFGLAKLLRLAGALGMDLERIVRRPRRGKAA